VGFYEEMKKKVSTEVKGSEWTPYRTLMVAGGALIVLGIVTVIVIRAKRKAS